MKNKSFLFYFGRQEAEVVVFPQAVYDTENGLNNYQRPSLWDLSYWIYIMKTITQVPGDITQPVKGIWRWSRALLNGFLAKKVSRYLPQSKVIRCFVNNVLPMRRRLRKDRQLLDEGGRVLEPQTKTQPATHCGEHNTEVIEALVHSRITHTHTHTQTYTYTNTNSKYMNRISSIGCVTQTQTGTTRLNRGQHEHLTSM